MEEIQGRKFGALRDEKGQFMVIGDRVDELVSRYLAVRGSDSPLRIEDLCKDEPELLPEVQRRVAVAEAFGLLATTSGSAGDTGPSPSAPFTSNDYPTSLDSFRVIRVLGVGGMGAVLLAEDEALNRRVAVKVMKKALAADAVARERFLREARAIAAIRYDHVVPIYFVGESEGTPYIVMPLLEGESLAARLERGPLAPAEVIRVGREAALGLAAAHAAGLVHRDVKPANLWLESPNGRVLVLDFGLAQVSSGVDALTRPGTILGTPYYMSPEQLHGGHSMAKRISFLWVWCCTSARRGLARFKAP